MNKNLIGLFLVANLHAQSYEALLEQAIQNNTKLQISTQQQEVIALKGQINTRYENPNLSLELANFDGMDNAWGGAVGMSQMLPLPAVQEDKKRLITNRIAVAKQEHILAKSMLIYQFSLLYLEYKEAKEQEILQGEALAISERILDIAQMRFDGGKVSQAQLLEAKIERGSALGEQRASEVESQTKKYALLKFANIIKDVKIDNSHLFVLTQTVSEHPLIKRSKAEQEVIQTELNLASHTIEGVEVFSEIEKEPNEDIFRVGVSIPLPLFHDKSQEKQLAKIALNNQKLLLKNQKKSQNIQRTTLQKEQHALEELQTMYKAQIEEKSTLLEMYERAYSIAKVKLIELQEAKRKLIKTKEKILQISIALEQNTIKQNYLQGAYHE